MSKKPLSKLESIPETKTDPPLSDALESEPQAAAEDGNAGTPRQGSRKFHPNQYGGKELCIVVSYSKAGKRNLKNLAKILTHKGKIEYDDYGDAEDWYRTNYETFKSHFSKLRRKAKDKGWWDSIPPDYYLSYS